MALSVVKLDQELVNDAEVYAKAENFSVSQKIEKWVRIGKIAQENADLTYNCKLLNKSATCSCSQSTSHSCC